MNAIPCPQCLVPQSALRLIEFPDGFELGGRTEFWRNEWRRQFVAFARIPVGAGERRKCTVKQIKELNDDEKIDFGGSLKQKVNAKFGQAGIETEVSIDFRRLAERRHKLRRSVDGSSEVFSRLYVTGDGRNAETLTEVYTCPRDGGGIGRLRGNEVATIEYEPYQTNTVVLSPITLPCADLTAIGRQGRFTVRNFCDQNNLRKMLVSSGPLNSGNYHFLLARFGVFQAPFDTGERCLKAETPRMLQCPNAQPGRTR